MPVHRKLLKQPLPDWQRISLIYSTVGDTGALRMAVLHKAQDQVFFEDQPEVRSRGDFEDLVVRRGPALPAAMESIARHVAASLSGWRVLREFIRDHEGELPGGALEDVREQLEWLIYDGYVEDTPVGWLPELERFLRGIQVRLEQARLDPATDALRAGRVDAWWRRYMNYEGPYGPALEKFRWMLEEFRVSVFAQGLGTSVRISDRRLETAWQEVREEQAAVRMEESQI